MSLLHAVPKMGPPNDAPSGLAVVYSRLTAQKRGSVVGVVGRSSRPPTSASFPVSVRLHLTPSFLSMRSASQYGYRRDSRIRFNSGQHVCRLRAVPSPLAPQSVG
jgi:hypothetical protein